MPPLPPRNTNKLAPAYKLTAMDWRFIEEYLLTLDPVEAARLAGFQHPERDGPRVLRHASVQDALKQARAFRSARTAIAADTVLRRWWLLATADVNDVMELRVVACRHCYGYDHQYQYRDNELAQARTRHLAKMMKLSPGRRVPFDDLGGGGYTTHRDPNPDCPECDGDGVPHGVVKDTRYLSPAGRVLYDGFEIKRDGSVKIKLRDRGYAETMVAKHLGMLPRESADVRLPIDPGKFSSQEIEAMLNSLPDHVRMQIEAMFENPSDDPRPVIDNDEEVVE